MVKFSVFAPVYNEQGNLLRLYQEVKTVMDKMGTWELVLINDGSRDESLKEMLSISDNRVVIIDLRRNYGQATAMDAGFRACVGDYIISLDADLQNDPADIPRMFERMQERNLDVIAGWRYKRKDPAWMLVITRSARFLRGLLVKDGVHDSGCTLRIYRSSVVKDLELWGEMHRYIIALLGWKGARIGEMRINHRARTVGLTKYNWKKSFKGLVDLIYIWFWKKFSNRPLHLFGVLGLGTFFVGCLTTLWTIYLRIFQGTDLSDSVWFMMSGFLILGGMQLFVFGVVFDLLIRTYYNTSSIEDRYVVERVYVGGKRSK